MDWITRKEAMEILGVSASRLSALISQGRIATQDGMVSRKDAEKQKATAKPGPRRTIRVYHDGTVSDYDVVDSVDLGDAEFVRFWCDELEDTVAAFVYPDEEVVTTDDWQGHQPEYVTDAKDYGWMLCTPNGTEPCIFVAGLPRSVVL